MPFGKERIPCRESIINKAMLTEEKIKEIVEAWIQNTGKLGSYSGGSGHLSHVTFRIDSVSSRILDNSTSEISFFYTLLTETEFTCYPDNPPYETPCLATIIVDTKTGDLIT
jgi:hypothetical protein